MENIELPASLQVVHRAVGNAKTNPYRVLLIVTGLAVLMAGLLSFVVPPGADTDPCWGFIVMHSMEHGGHLNMLTTPNPADIATDHSEFLAWWSPGQYMVPWLLKTFLNISAGHAVGLTVAICGLLGLAGFYKFFRKAGFDERIASISIAFIASQLFFVSAFVYYTGGEVLLFAVLGWFLYGCLYFKRAGWQSFVFLFIAAIVGFFAKSSFIWMFVAGALFMWINISRLQADDLRFRPKLYAPQKKVSVWITNGLLIGIPVIFSLLFLYIFYLSKGDIPAQSFGRLHVLPETFLFPLASPIVSAFSIDEVCDGLIYQPDGTTVSYGAAVTILVISALLSLYFIRVLLKYSPSKTYTLAYIAFYTAGVIFFWDMYLKQSGISFEARHFRVLGLIAIPGIIHLLFKANVTRVVFFMLWIASLTISAHIFFRELGYNRDAVKGNLGISEQLYDRPSMDRILTLDQKYPHQITFVVMASDIAAEIFNNRVITIETESAPDGDFSSIRYNGNCGRLYLLVPAEYVTPAGNSGMLKCFAGYHNFSGEKLSDRYYLFTAIN